MKHTPIQEVCQLPINNRRRRSNMKISVLPGCLKKLDFLFQNGHMLSFSMKHGAWSLYLSSHCTYCITCDPPSCVFQLTCCSSVSRPVRHNGPAVVLLAMQLYSLQSVCCCSPQMEKICKREQNRFSYRLRALPVTPDKAQDNRKLSC